MFNDWSRIHVKIPLDILYLVQTSSVSVPSIFAFFWLLTINKRAMSLLIRDFTFWFKYFYLIIYLITNAWLWLRVEEEEDGIVPIHFILMNTLLQTLMFSLTMVIDCLNIRQIAKVILSMIAMFFLADNVLGYQCVSLNRHEEYVQQYYDDTNVVINYPGIGPRAFNLFDYAATSAQILAIFSLKQIFSSILQPNKAAVLKKYPKIVYGEEKKVKKVAPFQKWKIFAIGFGILTSLHASIYIIGWIAANRFRYNGVV